MPALRIFGGLFAIFLLVSALIRYRRHQISRLNVIISWFIGLGLTLLAGRPSIFNGLFEVFHFEPGNGQRLTAVSMVAIVVLLLLLIRQQYTTDANERGLRLLVEALGRQAFDWAHSEELPVLIKPIVADEADMVNGSRLLGDFERESLIRHVGVHFFSRMVSVMTGQRVTDISSGYRATRAATLRKLVLEQDQFWTSEVLIEALRQHARIKEVPITIRARRGG